MQTTLYDALVRHQIYLQRHGKQHERLIAAALLRFVRQARGTLQSLDITGLDDNRIKTAIQKIILDHSEIMDGVLDKFKRELGYLMDYELRYNARVFQPYVAAEVVIPTPQQAQAAFLVSQLRVDKGKYLNVNDVFNYFGQATKRKVANAIREGFTSGLKTDEIAKTLSGVIDNERHNAMTLARTLTNHTAAQARGLFMQENDDVLDGYRWVSTLDSRTTLLCGGLDGKQFQLDAPDSPMPPAHYNCRSTIVPVVKAEYTMGRDIETTRTAETGYESYKTTYEEWLRRQPKEFQDDVLGEERGAIFRKGNLTLDKFVDQRGKTLTLDQLRKLDDDFN